jgi:hypothetical protein
MAKRVGCKKTTPKKPKACTKTRKTVVEKNNARGGTRDDYDSANKIVEDLLPPSFLTLKQQVAKLKKDAALKEKMSKEKRMTSALAALSARHPIERSTDDPDRGAVRSPKVAGRTPAPRVGLDGIQVLTLDDDDSISDRAHVVKTAPRSRAAAAAPPGMFTESVQNAALSKPRPDVRRTASSDGEEDFSRPEPTVSYRRRGVR